MNSDRQWMWINEYNWYKICAKTISKNMKTWMQYDSKKFQWKNYMNYISYHNEAIIW